MQALYLLLVYLKKWHHQNKKKSFKLNKNSYIWCTYLNLNLNIKQWKTNKPEVKEFKFKNANHK